MNGISRRTAARLAAGLVGLAGAAALSGTALAQPTGAYPNRPITVISPFSAGGDADLAARNFA
ncbi:MAG: hypothetical protein RJA10_2508, partial [Pseudomonadota bacterium]